MRGITAAAAAGWVSMYYFGITAGRFLNGFITAKLVLIGMGCAPIYPSMLHETPVRFGKNNSGRLMGVQMAVAYTGSTLVPPAIGLIMGAIGTHLSPIFIFILLVVMFISSEIAGRTTRGRAL